MANIIPEPEYVISLAKRLGAAREELSRLESEWAALFNANEARSDGPSMSRLADRIVDLLGGDISRSYTASEVAFSLGAKESSVSSILSRLVKDQKLEKRGHGSYGFRRMRQTLSAFTYDGVSLAEAVSIDEEEEENLYKVQHGVSVS